MKFYPPSWLTAIPKDLSGLGSIGDFVLRGKQDVEASNPAILISADDEKDVKTPKQLAEDVENLAAALARDLAWAAPASASAGNSSVIALLSENTVSQPWEERKGFMVTVSPTGETNRLTTTVKNVTTAGLSDLLLGNPPAPGYVSSAPRK